MPPWSTSARSARSSWTPPPGPIGFPESIPFTVEFTLADGGSMVSEANLPLHNGTVHWLTTCGVDVP